MIISACRTIDVRRANKKTNPDEYGTVNRFLTRRGPLSAFSFAAQRAAQHHSYAYFFPFLTIDSTGVRPLTLPIWRSQFHSELSSAFSVCQA